MKNIDSRGFYNKMNSLYNNYASIPWNDIGEICKADVQKNFDVGGRPEKWAPRKVRVPWPILKKSGTLQKDIYSRPVNDGVYIGSTTPYQAVQNFGYPPKNILARKFLLIQGAIINRVKKIIKNHLLF